jgi:ankyrin repeat protein
LFRATQGADVELIRTLLEKGANPNINTMGFTPFLLAAGVDPDVTDETGATALHHAAGVGDLDSITALIAGGADLDLRDHQHNSSPVLWAREEGHPEAVRLLLDRGARLNAPDAAKLGLTGILDGFLSDVPASRDRAVGWPTPLAGAIAGGQIGSVRLLLERGADPEAPTGHGDRPLDCVRWAPDEKSRTAIQTLLTTHGAQRAGVSPRS